MIYVEVDAMSTSIIFFDMRSNSTLVLYEIRIYILSRFAANHP